MSSGNFRDRPTPHMDRYSKAYAKGHPLAFFARRAEVGTATAWSKCDAKVRLARELLRAGSVPGRGWHAGCCGDRESNRRAMPELAR